MRNRKAQMKRLTNATVLAHFLRGAFFLILILFALHVMPGALARQKTAKLAPLTGTSVSRPSVMPVSSQPVPIPPASSGIALEEYSNQTSPARPSGTGCNFRVLIVYADSSGPPANLQSEILAEPGVTAVDFFDAASGTPTLAQLQQYNIVVPFSNSAFVDADTLGNNLADYVDGGGIVVQYGFGFYGPGQPYGVNGRWITGNYNPYSYSTNLVATAFTLGTFNAGHPLMTGVTTLNSNFQNVVTLAAGATEVAAASNANSLVAFRPVSGGHTTVGVTAYVGVAATQSGDWGRVIVNAGRWLTNCGSTCTPGWRNEPSISTARRNPATAVVGSNLYAITGFDSVSPYTTVNERFDGTTWTTKAPIPVRHAQSRAAAVGNKIYVPGGFNSIDFPPGPLNNMQIYDSVADSWSQGTVLPAARSGVAAAAFNGLVYVIAGYNPVGTGHNDVYIYDPVANSYSNGAPMPGTAGNVAGVLLNGEIYVVGGGTAPGAQYAYNPSTNTWRTIAVLPTSGGTCQSDNGFVLDNELWIVGCLGLAINQQVWIYTPGTDSWRAGPSYTVDHQGPGATLFNGRGFVVGGGSAGGGSTAVESVGSCAPTVTSAVSRKLHAGVPYDVNLPLTGTDGVECRTDNANAATSDYTMVVTFAGNVTVTGSPQAQVTMGTGCVGTAGVCTGNVSVSANVVTVPLTNVTNQQNINVRINGVNSAADAPAADINIPMGVLWADTNGNRVVNAADIAQTKAQSGQPVTAANFRNDVNHNGSINAGDISACKQYSGTGIP
jgi:hypothetical protein